MWCLYLAQLPTESEKKRHNAATKVFLSSSAVDTSDWVTVVGGCPVLYYELKRQCFLSELVFLKSYHVFAFQFRMCAE